ncbi:MAG: hydroxymethylpyrimidine/phosphomethylpyrimidine kinase, partial [Selenomonadales bacterium]|nr:hydroxymethylpyrimidine/phosphomethylpyrimidine kinase [Selenomonadales bacterium]
DPVMIATSGSALAKGGAVERMQEVIFPLATVITPNIPEAEVLSGMKIQTAEEMEEAAKLLGQKYDCAVLVKGGHAVRDASDVLWTKGDIVWFHGKHIDNPNTHGTGCTLSSAIASNLAKGYPLTEAIERAKAYISGALSAMLDLGQGSGPLDHLFDLTGEYAKEAK